MAAKKRDWFVLRFSIIFIALFLLATGLLSALLSWRTALIIVDLVLLTALGGLIMTLYYRRRQARTAPALLTLDPGYWSGFFVVIGILYPLFMVYSFVSRLIFLQHRIELLDIWSLATSIGLGWVWILIGRTKTVITEKGIFTNLRLIKWPEIESYEWRDGRDATLRLRTRHTFPLWQRVQIEFDPRHKSAVRELLQQKIRSLNIPGDPAIQQINYPADVSQ